MSDGFDIDALAASQIYFEDLKVGDVFATPSRTITEADIVAFAGLSGDYNRMHVDKAYAAQSAFGQTIAHGLLVLSVLSGLMTRSLFNQLLEPSLAGLLNIECQFPKPTFVGDTITGRIEITDLRVTSKGTHGVVTMQRQAINQRDEIVLDSRFKMLVALRAPRKG